jgi:toxin HigB-1
MAFLGGKRIPALSRDYLFGVSAHALILLDRIRDAGSSLVMIHSFLCPDTEALFHSQVAPRFRNIERVARRKLLQLHAATELANLRIPPGNQLEALKGDRQGQCSIRINDQWRVCFVWRQDGAYQVEIVDYH